MATPVHESQVPRSPQASRAFDAAERMRTTCQKLHALGMEPLHGVVSMLETAALKGTERVLEVGTGAGSHAALLSSLAAEVYTIEINLQRAARASTLLARLGANNVTVIYGDGNHGLAGAAPFDVIVVSRALTVIPDALLNQLGKEGQLLAPLGTRHSQEWTQVLKHGDGLYWRRMGPCEVEPLDDSAEHTTMQPMIVQSHAEATEPLKRE